MSTQTAASPAVDPTSAGDSSLDDLIARAAELKGELVTFAQSSRFAGRLTRLLRDAADRHGYLDEGTAVLTIDHFALSTDSPTGVPSSSDLSRNGVRSCRMTSGRWCSAGATSSRVASRFAGTLATPWSCTTFSTIRLPRLLQHGREALARLRPGMFAICRIVPVHPATDAWLISGTIAAFPKSARRQIAQTALQQITAHPQLLRRNPALLRRAWEIQAEHRAEFIAQVGSDLVVLPPHEAQETMREHYRRWQRKAAAKLEGKAAKRAMTAGPAPEELGHLPDELLDADSVALIYDEIEGLNFFRDFGRLDALFADPTLARDRTTLARLHEYLDDESVSPLAIRRLVQRHPEGADPVFRSLLRKPGFCWSRDGRNCSAATRSPSSTTNRRRASRPSANVSPSFAAPPPGRTAMLRRRERPRLRLSRGSRVRHLPGSGIGLALVQRSPADSGARSTSEHDAWRHRISSATEVGHSSTEDGQAMARHEHAKSHRPTSVDAPGGPS